MGTPKTPTLPGLWVVSKKEVMSIPNTAWGVKRLLINREGASRWSGYAIHGTNKPSSIGKEASHGCVRLFNEDITTLYDQISVGTPVWVVK